jgi:hypothetical protein
MDGFGGGMEGCIMPAQYCGPGCPGGGAMMGPGTTSQIAFLGVEGGEVSWDVSGSGYFDSTPLVMPGRQNFPQGAIYRLKLTNIPDRAGVELYPTLEVAPVTPRTDAFLSHSPIPIQFTDEDLDQVLSGNFVTKVIYLPDPEFQDLALAGVETLVSTRLDPGVDPIAEADRRGSILAILRIGNLDLQLPGQGMAMADDGVTQAQYDGQIIDEGPYGEEGYEGGYEGEGYADGGYAGEVCPPGYGGGGYGNGQTPMGMSTAGFAPMPTPPNLIAGVSTPQWGMPITGTPIGLPGPPHIPLGHPAGLVKHEMKNHTRILMPPPVHKMKMTVKQRPGMNYPRPVNHVDVSEINRAPLRLFGGTVPCVTGQVIDRIKAKHDAKEECMEGCPEDCPQ